MLRVVFRLTLASIVALSHCHGRTLLANLGISPRQTSFTSHTQPMMTRYSAVFTLVLAGHAEAVCTLLPSG
jgi:hypothetical protein